MPLTTTEAAQRSIEDATFAQSVLDGTEDYPEVRTAILADLQALAEEADVQGFLNPCPLPPGIIENPQDAASSHLSFAIDAFSWGSTRLPTVTGLSLQ